MSHRDSEWKKKNDNLTPVGTTKKLIRGGERESVNGQDWRLFKLSCRDSAAATLPTAASGPGIAQQIPTCLLLLSVHTNSSEKELGLGG